MSDEVIVKALQVAARTHCICYGECFETRHGMMHGPCEAELGSTAAAIAAFLDALPPGWHMDKPRDEIAAAIRRAGGAA